MSQDERESVDASLSVSGGADRASVRHVFGLAAVVLLVALSGYMAAAGGVALDFSIGGDAAPEATQTASGAGAQPGVVGPNAPPSEDRDGDGLADEAEVETYGTDPDDPDTDGDGIPDGMEVACTAAYPDADPLAQDVYVELDSVRGESLSGPALDQLRAGFADAPVDNPSGEDGVDLHVIRSDEALPQEAPVNDEARPGEYNDVEDYRAAHANRTDAGYYYLLVTEDVAYEGDAYYAGAGKPGVAIIETYDRDTVMASLAMHELGHAFGMDAGEPGVDDRTFERAAYESVMNYNALYDVVTYADGTGERGVDEWRFVAEDRYRPTMDTPDGSLCPAIDA